jgi:2-methylcitrate dehydratase PrpD
MVKDFSEQAIQNQKTLQITELLTIKASKAMGYTSAKLIAHLKGGKQETFDVAISKGHPGNPIGWADMKIKFSNLVTDENLWNDIQGFGTNKQVRILST